MKVTSNIVCFSLGALCALLPVAQVAADGVPKASSPPSTWPTTTTYPHGGQTGYPPPPQPSKGDDGKPYGGDKGPNDGKGPDNYNGQDGKPYGQDGKPYGGDGKGPDNYNGSDKPYGQDGKPYGQGGKPYGGDGKPYGQDGKPYGGDGKPPGWKSPQGTQVLYGQCGGYYYYGTTKCPDNAYCRKFSDWYSQCNPKGQ